MQVQQVHEASRREWDVVVIGTGVGGATLGHALAAAGREVLFVERGPGPPEEMPEHPPTPICDETTSPGRPFLPLLGYGAGGSSTLFGMLMERLFPVDFVPAQAFADAGDTDALADWPISHRDLEPWYRASERLYRLRGDHDPLRGPEPHRALGEPPALSRAGRALHDALRARGLHPYRPPLACEFLEGCRGCQAVACRRGCKNDAQRICLVPALERHGARLLCRTEVLALEASSRRVDRVWCESPEGSLALRARTVVLAAGALETPRLLLASRSHRWPHGLANGSGLVGRFLMRHLVDFYSVVPPSPPPAFPLKEVAFNDLYVVDGRKFGTVQSLGPLPQGGPSDALLLASVLEDLPRESNRVELSRRRDAHGRPLTAFRYALDARDAERLREFRALVRRSLGELPFQLVPLAEQNQNLGHACGTCRFGADPRRSVLDATNRAHELENLFVVDASFLPSSGGMNPALTIAANALRVADLLLQLPPRSAA